MCTVRSFIHWYCGVRACVCEIFDNFVLNMVVIHEMTFVNVISIYYDAVLALVSYRQSPLYATEMMEEFEILETARTRPIIVTVEVPVNIAKSHGGFRRAQRTKSTVTGSTVSFHGLNYFVDAPATGRRRCNCCRTVSKQILNDVRLVHICRYSSLLVEPDFLSAVFVFLWTTSVCTDSPVGCIPQTTMQSLQMLFALDRLPVDENRPR